MFLEKQLYIKRSKITSAGKGLFTKKKIPKGTRIAEYKGNITTWKKVTQSGQFNAYVYYINRNTVIDAKRRLKAFARYANDAKGITRIKGVNNNSEYVKDKGKIFVDAVKDIPAYGEILVGYGKEYWDVIKSNNKLALKEP
ncbi:MAG: SET domain-containing protein-lysine N-methyltransferase [Ginsengibacter sp.]|jgi:hypothetical protein